MKKVNAISPPKMMLRDLILFSDLLLFINLHTYGLVINKMQAKIVDVDVAITTLLFLLELDTTVAKI
jgi:hypothetical protein